MTDPVSCVARVAAYPQQSFGLGGSRTARRCGAANAERSRRGIALVVVLVVIAMISLGAYTFNHTMVAERNGAVVSTRQVRSNAAAQSGVEFAKVFFEYSLADQTAFGGVYDNSPTWQGVAVDTTAMNGAGASEISRFSVVAPLLDDQGNPLGIRFGCEDESAKLNLNSVLTDDGQAAGDQAAGAQGGAATAAGGSAQTGGATGQNSGGQTQTGGQASSGGGQSAQGSGGQTGGLASSAGGTATGSGTSGSVTGGASTADAGTTTSTGDPARDRLLQIPGMDLYIADAILDWIDSDDTPREYGAEVDYYSSLPAPYQPRNAPMSSLDELLLVRGVTAELLYGADRNRNGMLDSSEQGVMSVEATGSLDLGWSAYLTAHSQEKNLDRLGNPRIAINGDDLTTLHADLIEAGFTQDQATFVAAYRQSGPFDLNAQNQSNAQNGNANSGSNTGNNNSGNNGGGNNSSGNNNTGAGRNPGGQGGNGQTDAAAAQPRQAAAQLQPASNSGGDTAQAGYGNNNIGGNTGGNNGGNNNNQPPIPEPIDGRSVDLTQSGGTEIASFLDLIGAYVQMQFPGENQPVVIESPFLESDAQLPMLHDLVTTDDSETFAGRININQAPRAVLMTIPGMTDAIADSLLAQRVRDANGSESVDFQYVLWPLAKLQGTVTLEQLKPMLPYMSVGGDVHRAQVVGYLDNLNAYSRYEIVIDATGDTARIVSWKDLTRLGRGYSAAVLGGTAQ